MLQLLSYSCLFVKKAIEESWYNNKSMRQWVNAVDRLSIWASIYALLRIGYLIHMQQANGFLGWSDREIQQHVQTNIMIDFFVWVAGGLCASEITASILELAGVANLYDHQMLKGYGIDLARLFRVIRLIYIVLSLTFDCLWAFQGAVTDLQTYTFWRRSTYILTIFICLFVSGPVLAYFGNIALGALEVSNGSKETRVKKSEKSTPAMEKTTSSIDYAPDASVTNDQVIHEATQKKKNKQVQFVRRTIWSGFAFVYVGTGLYTIGYIIGFEGTKDPQVQFWFKVKSLVLATCMALGLTLVPIKIFQTTVDTNRLLTIYRLCYALLSLIFFSMWANVGAKMDLDTYKFWRRASYLLTAFLSMFISGPILYFFGAKVLKALKTRVTDDFGDSIQVSTKSDKPAPKEILTSARMSSGNILDQEKKPNKQNRRREHQVWVLEATIHSVFWICYQLSGFYTVLYVVGFECFQEPQLLDLPVTDYYRLHRSSKALYNCRYPLNFDYEIQEFLEHAPVQVIEDRRLPLDDIKDDLLGLCFCRNISELCRRLMLTRNVLRRFSIQRRWLPDYVNDTSEQLVAIGDDYNATILHCAVICGQLELVRRIQYMPVLTEVEDNQLVSPLGRAILQGNPEIVRVLLDSGAKIQDDIKFWDDAYEFAAELGTPQVLQVLCEKGGDLSAMMECACIGNNLQNVQWLLERGASLISPDVDAETPLWYAAREGHLELSEYLMDRGDEREMPKYYKESAFLAACGSGNVALCASFLNRGALIDGNPSSWNTPLEIAADDALMEVFQFLLDNGAYLFVNNPEKACPLVQACGRGSFQVCELLIQKDSSIVQWACREGKDGALHKAATAKSIECCNLLIQNGVDVNVRGSQSQTPLMTAQSRNQLEMTRHLLSLGADINLTDDFGWNALVHAARWQLTDQVDFLLASGAIIPEAIQPRPRIDIELPDGNTSSAWCIAAVTVSWMACRLSSLCQRSRTVSSSWHLTKCHISGSLAPAATMCSLDKQRSLNLFQSQDINCNVVQCHSFMMLNAVMLSNTVRWMQCIIRDDRQSHNGELVEMNSILVCSKAHRFVLHVRPGLSTCSVNQQ
ncbi:ankyrin repeat-containing domain protein [Gorgonomyces haynaldii]|nr:ankyrin repeat-containing domain protein [Gorgonomyces haynaldii]